MQIILEDDLDGGHAEETVEFALEGKQYVIDLNPDNAARLREALAPYMTTGRKAATGRTSRPSTPAKGRTNPNMNRPGFGGDSGVSWVPRSRDSLDSHATVVMRLLSNSIGVSHPSWL